MSPTSASNPVLRGGQEKPVACLHCRPTTTEDNVGSFGLKEMDERWMETGEGQPLSAVSKQRRTSLPTGGFVGVHVCFEEMPPRRHHSLTMSKYFLVSTY